MSYLWIFLSCVEEERVDCSSLITLETSDNPWRHDPPPPLPETRDHSRHQWSQPTRGKEKTFRALALINSCVLTAAYGSPLENLMLCKNLWNWRPLWRHIVLIQALNLHYIFTLHPARRFCTYIESPVLNCFRSRRINILLIQMPFSIV